MEYLQPSSTVNNNNYRNNKCDEYNNSNDYSIYDDINKDNNFNSIVDNFNDEFNC